MSKHTRGPEPIEEDFGMGGAPKYRPLLVPVNYGGWDGPWYGNLGRSSEHKHRQSKFERIVTLGLWIYVDAIAILTIAGALFDRLHGTH